MNQTAKAVALVVDSENRLLGLITDGDVRRGVLKGSTLDSLVEEVMSKKPLTVLIGTSRDEILMLMKGRGVNQVPLVDKNGHVKGIELLSNFIRASKIKNNAVVILAGGYGRRLRPITNHIPKPMLPVGGKPLLELLIQRLSMQGFKKFYIAVHYRKDVIQNQLGDGNQLGVQIHYINEAKPMGTVGALQLMEKKLDTTFLVLNGDLLTTVNFDHMLEYHRDGGQDLTIGVKEQSFQIPYGVIEMKGEQVTALEEKPIQVNLVNVGIYIMEPKLIPLIPKDIAFDMPELIGAALKEGKKVSGFPVHEYWLDIGHPDDYARAKEDVREIKDPDE